MSNLRLIPYRLNEPDEAMALCETIKEYYPQSPWLPSKDSLMNGSAVYFKAMLGNEQIGISGYIQKTPMLAETIKTTIFKDWRGKGLGKLLSLAIEDECRRNGIKKVMTTIFESNHSMIAIKLKQGYTIEGYHRDHEAPGFHEYSLGKILK